MNGGHADYTEPQSFGFVSLADLGGAGVELRNSSEPISGKTIAKMPVFNAGWTELGGIAVAVASLAGMTAR